MENLFPSLEHVGRGEAGGRGNGTFIARGTGRGRGIGTEERHLLFNCYGTGSWRTFTYTTLFSMMCNL